MPDQLAAKRCGVGALVAAVVCAVLAAGVCAALATEAATAPARTAAQEPASAPASAPAGEVTITCNILSNIHTGETDKSLFLIAYAGTPEIDAEFEKILAQYPDEGLDADAARTIQDLFMTRLKYSIDGPQAEKLWNDARWSIRHVMTATGTLSQRDGVKWFTLAKCQPAADWKFPARMLAPDKPFLRPDKPPLVIPISDKLSLKCLYVPAGRFLMGEPYYQGPHWQEDPPRMVTLTRPYYLAEHPVTQEIYEAVMGENPSAVKEPRLPVSHIDCAQMYAFCDRLAAKTGRKVRVPTAAEWEYAARVGTSNPTFKEKYADQTSNANSKYNSPPLPVMSRKPNAWGFYDMHSGWWERVADAPVLDRKDATDPDHTPPQDKSPATRAQKHKHFGKGQWTYYPSEVEYIDSSAGEYRFRVLVEAEGPASAPASDSRPAP